MPKVTVELVFPGDLKNEPIIYDIIRNYNVMVTILEASFTTEVGWAYLILEGNQPDIDKLFGYLKQKQVKIKPRE